MPVNAACIASQQESKTNSGNIFITIYLTSGPSENESIQLSLNIIKGTKMIISTKKVNRIPILA
jgi:hypothetical protein